MCGSKQRLPSVTLEKLPINHDQRKAKIACQSKLDRNIGISKNEVRDKICFPVKCHNARLSNGQIHKSIKLKNELSHEQIDHVLISPNLISAACRLPGVSAATLATETIEPGSLRASQEPRTSMLSQYGHVDGGHKRCRTNDVARLPLPKRRKAADSKYPWRNTHTTDPRRMSPFCDQDNLQEITQTHCQVLTPVICPQLLRSNYPPWAMEVGLTEVYRRSSNTKERPAEAVLELPDIHMQMVKRDMGIFHSVVQTLLINCIISQRLRQRVYLPLWGDAIVRICDGSCDRCRTERQRTVFCSQAGSPCQSRHYGYLKNAQEYAHINVSPDMQEQKEKPEVLSNRHDYQKVRSPSQNMKILWFNMPSKHQKKLANSGRFILALDRHLLVTFVSENVSRHLGYHQVDMLGHSISQFVHPAHMNDILRFTKIRHSQTDDKHVFPLWKTGRILTVAMRFCWQKTGTLLQDESYKQVIWTVNMRLKKRGQSIRVQDIVVLCKPIHKYTVASPQMTENMLSGACNISLNFHCCKPSSELAKMTCHHKIMKSNRINCLLFGFGASQPCVNHDESNNITNNNHNFFRQVNCELILKQLLSTSPIHLHVCCACISKWWTGMEEMPSIGQSNVTESYARKALQSSKNICRCLKFSKLFSNSFNSASQALNYCNKTDCITTACICNFIKTSAYLHHGDMKIYDGVNMFEESDTKSLCSNLKCNQIFCSSSKLKLQKVARISCCNQTSGLSEMISPHLVMESTTNLGNTPTDKFVFRKGNISDDSNSICEHVTDDKLIESESQGKSEASRKSGHKSFSVDSKHNSTEITTSSKTVNQNQHLPFDCKEGKHIQLSEYQCQDDVTSNCNLRCVALGKCSKTLSSSLSSISHLENMSPLPTKRQMNEDLLLQSSPIVSSLASTISTHNFIKTKRTLIESSLQDFTTAATFNSSTLCNIAFPKKLISQSKSPKLHHKISSDCSISLSPVNSDSSASNQIASVSVSTSADDDNAVDNPHSNNETRTNNTDMSLSTESTAGQTTYVNKTHSTSSKMTNEKFDPFLSQASFSDFNTFPGTDLFDDLTPVACPVNSSPLSSVTSQTMSAADHHAQSHLKNQFPSSNFHTFLVPATDSESFVSESCNDLDFVLSTIPVNHPANMQTMFSGWPASDTSQSSDSVSLSDYFSNKETSSKPSLLRRLLDKEGSAIQEPDNDAQWIFNQTSKRDSEVKKSKVHDMSTKIRYSVCKAKNKNMIRRSVELPKLRLNQRQMMQFTKCKPPFFKPTKELPLPPSIKVATHSLTSAKRLVCPENILLRESKKNIGICTSDMTADYELPDDLIDMAVECCAPLEMDQTEALISDLNDSYSWEDNLYSLLETSSQESSENSSGSQSPQQSSEMVGSKTPVRRESEVLPNFFQFKDNFTTESLACSPTAECTVESVTSSPVRDSSLLDNRRPNKEQLQSSSSETFMPSQQKVQSSQHNKSNPRSSDASSKSTSACTNRVAKMSLLREAITSDVDQLIEQIPLRNTKTVSSLHHVFEENEDDPDIQITKVIGLKKNHSLPTVHIPYCKINKVVAANTAKSPATISLCKPLHKSQLAMTASNNTMSSSSVQTFATKLSAKSGDKQHIQQISSCEHCDSSNNTLSIMNPLVIKISIGSSSTHKVVCVDGASQNKPSQGLKYCSQNRVSVQSDSSLSRSPKSSSTDLSSSRPVSVLIMRKENHRSRRSKSIAVQTDNEPGEIYPEFEHNPSDTIMYPSTIITYPATVSPQQDTSPSSTLCASQSISSDMDKFLPSHPNTDDSSSSADDDYRTISSTPFLWKLLTGELSEDHYQRLDQQMLEKERKKLVSQ